MTKTAYQYHVEEFEAFCKAEGVEGEEDMNDFASQLWDDLEDYRDSDVNPFELINYSAGVYLGEVEMIIRPSDLRFVDEYEADMWIVYDNMDNPDAHADRAEEFLSAFIGEDYDDPTSEDLNNYMRLNDPEYLVVLAAWNSQLNDDQIMAFHDESNMNTYQGIMEDS